MLALTIVGCHLTGWRGEDQFSRVTLFESRADDAPQLVGPAALWQQVESPAAQHLRPERVVGATAEEDHGRLAVNGAERFQRGPPIHTFGIADDDRNSGRNLMQDAVEETVGVVYFNSDAFQAGSQPCELQGLLNHGENARRSAHKLLYPRRFRRPVQYRSHAWSQLLNPFVFALAATPHHPVYAGTRGDFTRSSEQCSARRRRHLRLCLRQIPGLRKFLST